MYKNPSWKATQSSYCYPLSKSQAVKGNYR